MGDEWLIRIATALERIADAMESGEKNVTRLQVDSKRKAGKARVAKAKRGPGGKFLPAQPSTTQHVLVNLNDPKNALKVQNQLVAYNNGVSTLIATYVRSWQAKYKTKARPELRPAMGIFKACLKERSVEELHELIQVFCQMDDKWFLTKHHDIATFGANIGKVALARDKGHERPNGEKSWQEIAKEREEEHARERVRDPGR